MQLKPLLSMAKKVFHSELNFFEKKEKKQKNSKNIKKKGRDIACQTSLCSVLSLSLNIYYQHCKIRKGFQCFFQPIYNNNNMYGKEKIRKSKKKLQNFKKKTKKKYVFTKASSPQYVPNAILRHNMFLFQGTMIPMYCNICILM